MLCQRNYRVAGHTGQNGAFERRRHKSVVYDKHDVHRTHLFNTPVLDTIEPEHLGEALFLGHLAGIERSGVVCRRLHGTEAAFHRAYIFAGRDELYRVETFLVIGADRRGYDHEPIGMGNPDTEKIICCEDEGPYVKGAAAFVRYPRVIEFRKLLHSLQEQFVGNCRDTHALAGHVIALMVLVRPKEANLSVHAAKGFQTLKYRLSVMER